MANCEDDPTDNTEEQEISKAKPSNVENHGDNSNKEQPEQHNVSGPVSTVAEPKPVCACYIITS